MKRFLVFIASLLLTALALAANSPYKTYASGLSAASALGGTEKIVCIQGGLDVACTPAQLATYVGTIPVGTAQTWTAAQTFTNSDILLLGSSTGKTTFTSANAGASNFTLTFPAVTDTVATIGTAQTWTAAQTFAPINASSINITSVTQPSSAGLYKFATNSLGFSTNSVAAGDIDPNQHWRIGPAGSPTITSGTCGTGTNGTLSAASNDQAGEVIIGASAATACPVVFNLAYTTAPRAVLLTPGNAAAVGSTVLPYVSAISTTGFTITGSVLASTSFYYWVQ